MEPPKTPSIAIARELRRLGLKQGHGKDFAVTGFYRRGERDHTYVVSYGRHANRVIAEHADEIEQRTGEGPFPFTVSIRYASSGNPHTSVHNGLGERVRETPPAVPAAPAEEQPAEETGPARRLPPPIKPRVLVRAGDGHSYVTSDDRYDVTPAYSPTPQRGSASRVSYWLVRDRKGLTSPRDYPTLTDVREAYCAPDGRVPWLVCDMDAGVMRVEPTMRTAVAWAKSLACAPVRKRSNYPGGDCYDYVFGHPGEDSSTCVFIMRADVAHRHGFDPIQQPLCPFPDDPHEEVERTA